MFYGEVEGTGFVTLDRRFEACFAGHVRVERLWTGARWAEGPDWFAAGRYLVLPALLIACQYVSSAIISPPIDPNAENAAQQRVLYAGLPLMVGFFALNVPRRLGHGAASSARGRAPRQHSGSSTASAARASAWSRTRW